MSAYGQGHTPLPQHRAYGAPMQRGYMDYRYMYKDTPAQRPGFDFIQTPQQRPIDFKTPFASEEDAIERLDRFVAHTANCKSDIWNMQNDRTVATPISDQALQSRMDRIVGRIHSSASTLCLFQSPPTPPS